MAPTAAPMIASRDAQSPMVVKFSFPKSKIKVLLLENVHASAVELFKDEGFLVDSVPKALPEQELVARMEGVHLLGIRSKSKVTEAVLKASNRLLAVGCFCIGTDQVALDVAQIRGVPVFNAPFSNTRSVAELVLGELIALSRKLADKSSDMHAGVWSKSAAGCGELRGKTLGIVGFGHIGSQLSVLAEALGLHVRYYDVVPVLPLGNARACSSLTDLLGRSDFVSLHVPQAPSTNGLIGAAELSAMKKGACLVNASRGTVVDLEALAKALRTGHLSGAAVDVFPSEPRKNGPGFESPLRGIPNVILTPHIAGSTVEAQRNIGVEVAAALTRFVNQGSTAGAVNFPNIDVPQTRGSHRILNVHRNVPGMLSKINSIVGQSGSNVHVQVLGTTQNIGYIVLDIDKEAGDETKSELRKMDQSIATRILY